MSLIIQNSKIQNKISTIPGVIPTIPTSDNHTDGTWSSTDIYLGELFINITDNKVFTRTENGIIQLYPAIDAVASSDVVILRDYDLLPEPGTTGRFITTSTNKMYFFNTFMADYDEISTAANIFWNQINDAPLSTKQEIDNAVAESHSISAINSSHYTKIESDGPAGTYGAKQDKEEGKGLSTNDFTDEYLDLLTGYTSSVESYANFSDFPGIGKENTIYIDESVIKFYIWNNSDYIYTSALMNEDIYTTGATLDGSIISFNRNDGNTYNLDLTPLSATPVTSLSFSAITDTPTTILGYGISDAYTQTEIDTKILWEKGIGNLSVKTKGTECSANNSYAVATGFITTANGVSSNAQNQSTVASGNYSNAAGLNTLASGTYAFSEGFETNASGIATHAAGQGTIAHDYAEFVIGKYNIPGTSTGATDSLFTVGNGVNIYSRSNAFQIKNDGTLILTQPSTALTDSYLTINESGVVTKKSFADNYNQLKLKNTYTISHSGGDFNNIKDAITYIENEFYGYAEGITLLLDSGDFSLDSPIIVNCTQNIALIGKGVNVTNITTEGVGIMFDCRSNINFEGINFIGDGAESDTCIKYSDNSYKEIKNCNFSNGFLNAIELSTGSLFIFNFVITDCVGGIYVYGDGEYNALDAEVGNITNCGVGIELGSGVNSIFNIHSVFFNPGYGNCGINYVPEHYTYYGHPSIQACHWNNTGIFFKGFDFNRHDGRDANICIQNNVGSADLIPYAYLNIINNTTPTNLGNNTWTKLNYTGTTTVKENKIYFTGNRFTYQPTNTMDLTVIGSGSITTSTQPANIELALVKNGNTGSIISPISITLDSNSKKFQWAANAYIPGVVAGDYFEVFGRGVLAEEKVVLEDFNLLIKSM